MRSVQTIPDPPSCPSGAPIVCCATGQIPRRHRQISRPSVTLLTRLFGDPTPAIRPSLSPSLIFPRVENWKNWPRSSVQISSNGEAGRATQREWPNKRGADDGQAGRRGSDFLKSKIVFIRHSCQASSARSIPFVGRRALHTMTGQTRSTCPLLELLRSLVRRRSCRARPVSRRRSVRRERPI